MGVVSSYVYLNRREEEVRRKKGHNVRVPANQKKKTDKNKLPK